MEWAARFCRPHSVVAVDGKHYFTAKSQAWDNLLPRFESQLVEELQILWLRHDDSQAGFLECNRKGITVSGHRLGNQFQGLGIDLNAGAIQIGNVGNFRESRDEINLGDLAALQQQLAKMNTFSPLIEEDLIEIGRGEMAALAKYFPQLLFLHLGTLVPGHVG